MRTNLSDDDKDYIEEIKDALQLGTITEDEIVKIDDQYMTAGQAIRLEHELTARNYRARKSDVLPNE